jgi:flavin reductase (DIM6/NTAB) family NADH-FMN oxidoreductase RutF
MGCTAAGQGNGHSARPAGQATGSEFRDAMACIVQPVAVVTAFDGCRPHGTTVGTVTALSLTPPLVSIALDNGSDLLRIVRRAGWFGINLLRREDADLARRFAAKGRDKFAGADWTICDSAPRLVRSGMWVACSVHGTIAAGDHTVIHGLVRAADVTRFVPLVYHVRQFSVPQPVDLEGP